MSNLPVATYRVWAKAGSAPDDAILQAAIDAAEDMIDDHCRRRFFVADPAVATARLFTPDGTSVLAIDDCVAVTAVTDNGTAVGSTLYQLEPVNGLSPSGIAVPYDSIRLLGGRAWVCDYDKATVSVTARWGWSALPAKYVEAVKLLTKDLVDSADIRGGVVGFGDFGAVRIRQNPHVRALLAKLDRTEPWAIVP